MSLLSVSTLTASNASAMLAEGGVNVDLDSSLFVQLGLFFVLLLVLKPTLFDPMMRLFEEREKRIDGTRREAAKEDERSAKALAKYEAMLAKAREAGSAERDALRNDGLKNEVDILAAVRTSTTATLEQGRAGIAREAQEARSRLKGDALVLAREIASRVLEREVSS